MTAKKWWLLAPMSDTAYEQLTRIGCRIDRELYSEYALRSEAIWGQAITYDEQQETVLHLVHDRHELYSTIGTRGD